MRDDVDWPDDLRCGKCGDPISKAGAKIHLVHLVSPLDPELYGWCEKHTPKKKEDEQELWKRVKEGKLSEQAQSLGDYE